MSAPVLAAVVIVILDMGGAIYVACAWYCNVCTTARKLLPLALLRDALATAACLPEARILSIHQSAIVPYSRTIPEISIPISVLCMFVGLRVPRCPRRARRCRHGGHSRKHERSHSIALRELCETGSAMVCGYCFSCSIWQLGSAASLRDMGSQ